MDMNNWMDNDESLTEALHKKGFTEAEIRGDEVSLLDNPKHFESRKKVCAMLWNMYQVD